MTISCIPPPLANGLRIQQHGAQGNRYYFPLEMGEAIGRDQLIWKPLVFGRS